jgi:hypothetical protein
MSDWFYALRVSKNHRASKGYCLRDNKWWREYDYNAGWEFDAFRSSEFDCLDGLADAIKQIESRRNFFVIRGELINGEQKASGVNRRAGNLNDGKLPCWRAQDRQWAMFDIDTIDWTGPRVVSQLEYEAELKEIIASLLPSCFDGVSFFYQLSSSAGLSKADDGSFAVGHEKLKVHLWYWLDRSVCDASMRQWIRRDSLPIDHAPFNPVQPHFTSVPEFMGGEDPVGFRSGLVRGASHFLVLPDCVLSGQDYAKKTQRRRVSTISFYDKARFEGGAIPRAVAKILSVTNGRHHELNRQAFTLGGLIGNGTIDYNDAFEQIINASITMGILPSEAARIAAAGLDLGMTRPFEIAEKDFVERNKNFTPTKFSLNQGAGVLKEVLKAIEIEEAVGVETMPAPPRVKRSKRHDKELALDEKLKQACVDLFALYETKAAQNDYFCLFDDDESRHIALTLKDIWAALRRARYNHQFDPDVLVREISAKHKDAARRSYLLYIAAAWFREIGLDLAIEITDTTAIKKFAGLTSIVVSQIGVAALTWPRAGKHAACEQIDFDERIVFALDLHKNTIGYMSQRSYYAMSLFVELVGDNGQKSYVFEMPSCRRRADSDLIEFQVSRLDIREQFVWNRLCDEITNEYAAQGQDVPSWFAEGMALNYVNDVQNRRSMLMNEFMEKMGAI